MMSSHPQEIDGDPSDQLEPGECLKPDLGLQEPDSSGPEMISSPLQELVEVVLEEAIIKARQATYIE